ncbi:unnamed protein product [Blepharisma stoltei]|uniref:RING-type domain-containing protein n=1 Tax=Blepharisma stoltei TaxID=1481888 RepID=A0AAU9K9I0_9CILI|nr:unnamed protein product [Blepharisma stoltei]
MTEEGSLFSSIGGLIKAGFKKTEKALSYVKDGIVNYGKCYMCKEQANCDIPCGHILCYRCLNFYIESQGIPNPEFVLCYICQKPIPLENIPIDYDVYPYEEEKIPVHDTWSLPSPKKWIINQEETKFTILELPEEEEEKPKDLFVSPLYDSSSSSSSSEGEDLPEEIAPFPINEIRVKECPFCEWSLEISTASRYEVCKNVECNRTFCPQCNQIPHPDKSCSKKDSERKVTVPYDPKCPICLAEFIKEEGCNFLWCPNTCAKTCFCLICGTHIARCEYFTHYTKSGPFGNTCNGNKD